MMRQPVVAELARVQTAARYVLPRVLLLVLPRVLLLVLPLVLPVTGVASADDASTDPASPDVQGLTIRRVFAPADRSEQWPMNQGAYVPMAPEEFENQFRRLREATGTDAAMPEVTIDSAEYQARLEGDHLVAGRALLRVHPSAEQATLLSMSPCSLAIRRMGWQGASDEVAAGGLDEEGRFLVLVPRAGSLEVDWTLRGRRDAPERLAFLLELPRATISTLDLELPAGSVPQVDHGLVFRQGEPNPKSPKRKTPEAGSSVREADEPLDSWRIELGGRGRIRLRIVQTDPRDSENGSKASSRLVRARQSNVYDLSLQGLNLLVSLHLDALEEPVGQIVVAVDERLRLSTARYGQMQATFSPMAGGPSGSTRRIVIELPEPVRGTGRVLRLGAIGPLTSGTSWDLPVIEPVGLDWESAETTLRVLSPLEVGRLDVTEGRHVAIGPLTATTPGESLQLEHFTPESRIRLTVLHRHPPVQVDACTSIELSSGEIRARVVADLRLTEGERFEVSGTLARQWRIDGIESVPPSALGRWTVEPAAGGRRQWRVRLARPVSPEYTPRLVLVARRPTPASLAKVQEADLVPVQFDGEPPGRRLIGIHAVKPLRITLEGLAKTLDAEQLDPVTRQRFLHPEPSPSPSPSPATLPRILLDAAQVADFGIRVATEARQPTYTAKVDIQAHVAEEVLDESYRIECLPQGAPLDRIRLRFVPARSAPLQWHFDTGDLEATVQRDRTASDDTSVNPSGETWEIRLKSPRSNPFVFRARRTMALDHQPVDVSLPWMREASEGDALLTILQSGSVAWRVENGSLRGVPRPTVPPAQTNLARAAFRYDPTETTEPAEPTVRLVPVGSRAIPSAIVWNCLLRTRLQADGTCRHLAEYRLQNAGRTRLQFTLPESTDPDTLHVWLDQVHASWRRIEPETPPVVPSSIDPPRIEVDLPAHQRFPTVSIEFGNQRQPLGLIDHATPSIPEPDVPILATRWILWLPPNFEATDFGPYQLGDSRLEARSTARRIFGPLGRPRGCKPFDPSRRADWKRLVPMPAAARRESRLALAWIDQFDRANTWGECHATASETVLVDHLALETVGVGPSTPMPNIAPNAPFPRGLDSLFQAGLAVLAHPDALVLTTVTQVALDHRDLESIAPLTWRVRPGPLFDRIHDATTRDAPGRLLTVRSWADHAERGTGLVTGTNRDSRPGGTSQSMAMGVVDAESRPGRLSDGFSSVDTTGWTATATEPWGEVAPRITIVRRAIFPGLRWLGGLVAFGLPWVLTRGRPAAAIRVSLVVALVAALGAIWTTWLVGACLSGIVLGAMAHLAVRLLGRVSRAMTHPANDSSDPESSGSKPSPSSPPPKASRLETSEVDPSGSSPRGGPPVGRAVLVLLAATIGLTTPAIAPSTIAAQQPPSSEPMRGSPMSPISTVPMPPSTIPTPLPTPSTLPSIRSVYQIFIPVDDQDQPTGDNYSIPEALHAQMQRRLAALQEQNERVLITSVRHDVVLQWTGDLQRLELADWTATFTVANAGRASSVRIPLSRRQIELIEGSSRLDGVPVSVWWESEDRALVVPLFEPGTPEEPSVHELELRLRPTLAMHGTERRLEFHVPRIPSASLRMVVPPDAPPLAVPTALGGVDDRHSVLNQLSADLGPADRLTIRWHEDGRRGATRPATVVDQRTLLKIQVGSVVLDSRWHFRSTDGQVRRVELAIDPRLRLLPLPENSPVGQIEMKPGDPATVQVDLSPPITEGDVLQLRFLLSGSSGVGRPRIRSIDLLGVQTAGGVFGVWVDPRRELVDWPKDLEAVDVAGFDDLVGPFDVTPQRAWSLDGRGSPIGLTVRPRQPVTRCDQRLVLAFGPSEARFDFQAELAPVSGTRLHYLVKTPATLLVDSITIREGTTNRLARYSRNDKGDLTVFLNRSPDGPHVLSIQGRIPLRIRQPFHVPKVHIDQTERGSSRLGIYREPSVLVSLKHAQEPLADVPPPGIDPTGWGRQIGWFRQNVASDDETDKSSENGTVVTIEPNRPVASVDQVTTLLGDASGWNLSARFDVRVEQGMLDHLRLELPHPLAQPPRIEPPTWTVEPAPSDPTSNGDSADPTTTSSQLVLRPTAAVQGHHQVELIFPWQPRPGRPATVPDVRPIGLARGQHRIVLPNKRAERRLSWETKNLRPVIEQPRDDDPTESLATIWQVDGETLRAVLLRETGQAEVVLRQARLAWETDRSCRGRTLFHLIPGELDHLIVAVPDDCRLVRATLAGASADAVALGDHRWRIRLGKEVLPQCLEIIHVGTLPPTEHDGRQPVSAPHIESLSPRRTIWTFHPPAGHAVASDTLIRDEATAALTQLQNLLVLLEEATETRVDDRPGLDAWYATWSYRWASTRAWFRSAIEASDASWAPSESLEELARLDLAQAQLAEQLAVPPTPSPHASHVEPIPGWTWATSSTAWVIDGPDRPTESIRVVRRRRETGSGLMATLILLSGLAIISWGRTRAHLANIAHRWPHSVALLIAIAWWLLLLPSILGLILLIITLHSIFLPRRPKPRRRHSAIVPVAP